MVFARLISPFLLAVAISSSMQEAGEEPTATASQGATDGLERADAESQEPSLEKIHELIRLGQEFEHRGEIEEARDHYGLALTAAEELLDPEAALLAGCNDRLASVLFDLGNFSEAEFHWRRALELQTALVGLQHVSPAKTLFNLGLIAFYRGDHEAALSLLERSLAIREDLLDSEHPSIAVNLNCLAAVKHRSGDIDGASMDWERALEIQQRTLGDHVDTATTLGNLGVLNDEHGHRQQALVFFERALVMLEAIFGPEHPSLAPTLINLGDTNRALGDFAAATRWLERGIAIQEQALGPMHHEVAQGCDALGQLLEAQGLFDEAKRQFERALAIREATLGPEHPQTATSLHNLANLHLSLGEYELAESLFERALAIEETIHGPLSFATVETLQSLGILQLSMGRYEEARPTLERALDLFREWRGPDHPDTALALEKLAMLLTAQGNDVAARPMLENSLAILEKSLGPNRSETASSLHNLGSLLVRQGEFEAALPLLERALSIREEVFGSQHPDTAHSLNTLAIVMGKFGDLEAAVRFDERALAIREATLGPNHEDTAVSLHNLGVQLAERGDHELAEQMLARALGILEGSLGSEHPSALQAMRSLAMHSFAVGDHEEARALLLKALTGQEAHLARLLPVLSERERFLLVAHYRSTLSLFLEFTEGSDEYAATSYDALVRWKGQVFRSMSSAGENLAADLSDAQRARRESLRAVESELSRLSHPGFAVEGRSRRIGELQARKERYERELASTGELTGEHTPGLAEIRAALPRGTALVDFFVHESRALSTGLSDESTSRESRISAWIVTPEEPGIRRVSIGPAAEIETRSRVLLAALSPATVPARDVLPPGAPSRTDRSARGQSSRELRELLWDPIVRHLDEPRIVFVCPDDFLATLPLEILEDDDGNFLVERTCFVYLEDASALPHILTRSRHRDGTLLAVGGVDFGDEALSEPRSAVFRPTPREGLDGMWVSLEHTLREAHRVSDLHRKVFESKSRLLLESAEATEEQVKLAMSQHTFVHLATHGYFEPDGLPSLWANARKSVRSNERIEGDGSNFSGLPPGLLSGLVLAGANRVPSQDRDDGLLTAEEIGSLDLSGVELVVLSACKSGLGSSRSGEGMLGLRRAIRQAGARTVVSSLWTIPDRSTEELMAAFYRRLWVERSSTIEALRGAQLELLRKNRRLHGKAMPWTWGAFVLSGDWR